MKRILICLCIVSMLIFSACNTDTSYNNTESSSINQLNSEQNKDIPSASGEIFAMDTYMSITCYGDKCEEALNASLDEIKRLDELLSVGNEDSEIYAINENGSGSLSAETMEMVKKAISLTETTDGAFDITVYPLMELWGFTTGNFVVPEYAEIKNRLTYVGSELLALDEVNSTLTLSENQGIDLGGIAKGFTSGRIMEIFEEYDLVSGVVSLGGNVQCYGTKPDGSLWRCGIENPFEPEDDTSMLGVLSVADKAVITSGAYERYFTDEETGETYHHILDPKTGYPANNGLVSVTVVSENGMLADGLSTACYVMGLEKSISYWQTYGNDFDLIMMTEKGDVYITEGVANSFTSDFTTYIVK